MKRSYLRVTLAGALVLVSGIALAAEAKPQVIRGKLKEPATELTERGPQLEAEYTKLMQSLKTDIEKQLPAIDEVKVAAWRAAINAEEEPEKAAEKANKTVEKMRDAPAKLKDMEDRLRLAPKTLEDAMEELRRARARGEEDPSNKTDQEKAQSALERRQKDQKKLEDAIAKAKLEVKEAETQLPEAVKAADAAQKALDHARAATWKAMDALGTNKCLTSNKLDGKLAQFMVIHGATPRGLAAFAQKSPDHEKLVQQLFDDKELMIQMVVADGPDTGKYGEAMKLYTDIQRVSPKAKEGLFQRLAVAVSLGHAEPLVTRLSSTHVDSGDGSETKAAGGKESAIRYIDPVKRYLNYEKWYLAGGLQPHFKDLSVWLLALTVNSHDPDEALAWGREMTRTMRPDCIPVDGDTSGYVDIVDKEIKYGSDEVKNDLPNNAFMQNVLANGGICGRRGFFGTFLLQAFGVPAVERPEPKHSTLAHWHPDGWKTKLGAQWGSLKHSVARMGGRTKPYGADANFLVSSQAREEAIAFMKVKRAQWIGALMGEPEKPGLVTRSDTSKPARKGETAKPIFWTDLALQEQQRIIVALESAKKKSPVATPVAVKAPAATGKITVDDKGVITIPAAACSSPTETTVFLYHGGRTNLISFVKDNKSGETRVNFSRYCKESDVIEYTFDAPRAGTYQLVSEIATGKWDQRLRVTANGGQPVEMPLPYTIGLWGKTAPVAIELKAGKNVLKFYGPVRVTVGRFTLTPSEK